MQIALHFRVSSESMLLVEKPLWRIPSSKNSPKAWVVPPSGCGMIDLLAPIDARQSTVAKPRSGHEGRQNSFKPLAISAGPVKCFFTSPAQAVILGRELAAVIRSM